MKISGNIKINNKWQNGAKVEGEFDFKINGTYANGSLSWSDVKKGKNGAPDEFTSTSKRFICFDADSINFLQHNLGKLVEIDGKLVGHSRIDEQGKKVKNEQIIINGARIIVKNVDAHNSAKANAYQPQNESVDNEVPFDF